MEFSFSPHAAQRIERFGGEAQAVVIIDEAANDAERLADEASSLPFSRIGPYYPGVRAPLGAEFLLTLCAAAREVAADVFHLDFPAWRGACFYSLMTTPPEALLPIQRFPHYDGVEHERIAILHYLTRADLGGTAFFRHRSTGFETVTVERFDPFRRALEEEVRASGLPPPAYIGDGAPYFERIGLVSPAFNRMLIYKGNSLHCSAIGRASALSADPRRGRLTVNAFLAPAPAA